MHAPTLNYLGYMLAERGQRLDEAVTLIAQAVKIDPFNGSYLDSLGWAYFKQGKLDQAREYLVKAGEQMPVNSVVQDHVGDVLFALRDVDGAIAAWQRALNGDGRSIDRTSIERKISRPAHEMTPHRPFVAFCLIVLARRRAASGCAAKRFEPPTGAGEPLPEFTRIFEEATKACRDVRTLTAEAGLSGRLAGQRVRGRLHMGLGRSRIRCGWNWSRRSGRRDSSWSRRAVKARCSCRATTPW